MRTGRPAAAAGRSVARVPDTHLAALELTHLNLDVANLDVSERFYREEFGLPVRREPASLAVRTPAFLLVLAAGAPQAGGGFHFGFRVGSPADVDAWFARFVERGVPVTAMPETRGAVYVGRVRDPDGYAVEIYSEA